MNIHDPNDKIDYRNEWNNHILRMGKEQLLKKKLNNKPKGNWM